MAGLKKIGMELGSATAPVIVHRRTADLDSAVESCVSGAFWAVGQNCIGVQRIYVHEAYLQWRASRSGFVERTRRRYKTGYQLEEDTDMGPMITRGRKAKRVEGVDHRTPSSKGAMMLTGGRAPKALSFNPTVLEPTCPPRRSLDCEEVFGPVVSLLEADQGYSGRGHRKNANAVDFGLHGADLHATTSAIRLSKSIKEMDVGSVLSSTTPPTTGVDLRCPSAA